MTDIEKIRVLSDAADFLGDRSYEIKLERIRESLESNTYHLSVMGQFSAGKSKLINSLLGRNVLPVHITETTALVTFISFSENEHAELIMENGFIETLSLEEALNIWQNGAESQRISDAASLCVYLNNNLLKNGLIIVDTPGINTILDKHVSITESILEKSDSVLYVMGKSLSLTDVDFIQGIINSGIDIVFARTHMDEIKSSEEDSEKTILQERKTMEEYTDSDNIFFVSNEKDSPYHDNIKKLENWLSTTLSSNTKAAIEASAEKRIVFIAKLILKKLKEKETSLSSVVNKNKEDFLIEKNKIEQSLNNLEQILKKKKIQLEEKMEYVKSQANHSVNEICESSFQKISSQIAELKASGDMQYQELVKALTRKECASIRNQYLSYFDNFLAENQSSLIKNMEEICGGMYLEAFVPSSLSQADDYAEDIYEEMTALEMLCTQMEEKLGELELEKNNADRKIADVQLEQEGIKNALQQAKSELQKMEPYKEQYKVVQQATNTNEHLWGLAGKVLDWAALLIPGDIIAMGAAKVFKVGANVAKSKKVTDILNKGAKVLSEGSKVAKGVDAGLDIGKVLRVFGKRNKNSELKELVERGINEYDKTREKIRERRENNEDTLSFLDYLTLEHWFGQIGKKFDTPEILALDLEAEEKYKQERLNLEQNLEAIARKEARKQAELMGIKDEKEKAEIETRKLETLKQKNKMEFEKLKQKAETEKKKKQHDEITRYYSEKAREVLEEYCKYLTNGEGAQGINMSVENYINTYDFSIARSIQSKRLELEALEKSFSDDSKRKIEEQLSECLEHIKVLSSIEGY